MSDKLSNSMRAQTSTPEAIKRLLKSRGVGVGEVMPSETDLAQTLGVGRAQVREALSGLEMLGAVRTQQGARRIWKGFDAGAYAASVVGLLEEPKDSARDLLELRHSLEVALLPTAANLISEKDLNELKIIAEEMTTKANNGESFSKEDEYFHRKLFKSINNKALDKLLQSFWHVLNKVDEPGEPPATSSPEMARMHEYVIEAIEKKDIRRAVHELDAHFYGVTKRLNIRSE